MFGESDDEEQLDKLLTKPKPLSQKDDGITVLGVGNLKTAMANCCHPVPGDQIIGYITQGRGVTVHRQDCPNILQLRSEEPGRIVDVEWGSQVHHRYPVDIEIEAWDRSGLLRDVIHVLSHDRVNVLAVNTLTDKADNVARLKITVEVDSLESLGRIFSRIQQLPNIIDVKRLREGAGKKDAARKKRVRS